MVSQDNVKEFKVKTIKDLELMSKKLKKRIVLLEKESNKDSQDMINIVHSMTLLIAEYRAIKREIMDIIML